MKLFLLLLPLIWPNLAVAEGNPPRDPASCQSAADSECICPPVLPAYSGPACMPKFQSNISKLSMAYRTMMSGRSYHEGCPVSLDDLRLVTFTHWGYDGLLHDGQLVVAATVAGEVEKIMAELYLARFPISKARLVDYYRGLDELSMADNNSSGFNCRRVTGSAKWSEHSYGQAIDINPVQNPFVTRRGVEPASGEPFTRRDMPAQGLIREADPVVQIFAKYGWKWGGRWQSSKDYQHFSKSGR